MRTIHPTRRALLLVTAAATAVAFGQNGFAGEQRPSRYEGSGARVVRVAGQTLVDEGSMTCSASTGFGTGGACLRFDPTVPAPAVFVRDDDPTIGATLPYQVCVDNDGDGFCTSPSSGPCGDDIVFSHADGGAFYNPLTVPPGFRPGCPGAPYAGYVVFLCTGVHADPTPHTHGGTTGTARLVSGGTGTGDFCGGSQERVSSKQYTITP